MTPSTSDLGKCQLPQTSTHWTSKCWISVSCKSWVQILYPFKCAGPRPLPSARQHPWAHENRPVAAGPEFHPGGAGSGGGSWVTCSPRCATSKASCSLILSSSLMLPARGPAGAAGAGLLACFSLFRLSSILRTALRTSDTVSWYLEHIETVRGVRVQRNWPTWRTQKRSIG